MATAEQSRLKKLRYRQEAIEKLGGRCACCGESLYEFLQIDHINNDGHLERKGRKSGGSGGHTAEMVRRSGFDRSRYQILCANCHNAKSWYGGCPHKGVK